MIQLSILIWRLKCKVCSIHTASNNFDDRIRHDHYKLLSAIGCGRVRTYSSHICYVLIVFIELESYAAGAHWYIAAMLWALCAWQRCVRWRIQTTKGLCHAHNICLAGSKHLYDLWRAMIAFAYSWLWLLCSLDRRHSNVMIQEFGL